MCPQIVDFYSTEDFLQILGVFPMAIHFVLAGVEWDLERENTMSVHNSMEISFELTEREEETPDGETVVAFFQKRERFKNYIPLTRFLMWDQTQCYGYNRRQDGKCEVFHRGENFYGPLPVRLLVQLHARYVIWATEKHINSKAFGAGDLEEQEHQRSNIPKHVLSDFVHRLAVAQKIAIEAGKAATGSDTEKAEETLRKLQKLQRTQSQAYVSTVRRHAHEGVKLKRQQSSIVVANKADQAVIDSALANLAKTKEGQAEAQAALKELLEHPQIEREQPRYGGAFRGAFLKGMRPKSEEED